MAPAYCVECGADVRGKYCWHCGTLLGPENRETAAPADNTAPRRKKAAVRSDLWRIAARVVLGLALGFAVYLIPLAGAAMALIAVVIVARSQYRKGLNG